MTKRIFTWYVEEVVGDGVRQGPTFITDTDYALPGVVRMYAKRSPDSAELTVDINVGGVSIFTARPTLQKGQNEMEVWEVFDDAQILIEAEKFISLDVDASGGAKGITVQLELEADE